MDIFGTQKWLNSPIYRYMGLRTLIFGLQTLFKGPGTQNLWFLGLFRHRKILYFSYFHTSKSWFWDPPDNFPTSRKIAQYCVDYIIWDLGRSQNLVKRPLPKSPPQAVLFQIEGPSGPFFVGVWGAAPPVRGQRPQKMAIFRPLFEPPRDKSTTKLMVF